MKTAILTFFVIFTMQTWASGSVVLNYSQWKSQQITEAQNRVVRLDNRIVVLRSTTGDLNEINRLEAEFRGAEQYVEVVKDLTIEDYFNVYLVDFSDDNKVLLKVAKTMSKTEVAELLRLLLKNRTEASLAQPNASSFVSGLTKSKQNYQLLEL